MQESTTTYAVSEADLQAWLAGGRLTPEQAELIRSSRAAPPPTPKPPRDLNAVSIAYYFGGIFILFAYLMLLVLQWPEMTLLQRTVVAGTSVLALLALGWFIRARGYPTAGNLLAFVGAAAVPSAVWAVMQLAGLRMGDFFELLWHDAPYRYEPNLENHLFFALACLVLSVGLLAVYRYPLFGLMTAIWIWLASNALLALFIQERWLERGDLQLLPRSLVGLFLIAAGYLIQRKIRPDFSLWFYLAGQLILFVAFLTALHGQPDRFWIVYQVGFIVYYIASVVASVWLQRRVFLVFGALGIYYYLFFLAGEVVTSGLGFIVVIAASGLLIILLTILYQKYVRRWLEDAFHPSPGE